MESQIARISERNTEWRARAQVGLRRMGTPRQPTRPLGGKKGPVMAQDVETLLGNAWHTLYSDELWYLIVTPDSGEVRLEGRFQTDAPDRTGHPTWARTEFCVAKARNE